MSTVLTKPETSAFVRSVFLDAPQLTHAGQPDWFIASQHQAWQTFTSLPMPGRKDENWRFANTAALDFDRFKRMPAAGGAPAFAGLEKVAARVVTVNDEVINNQSSVISGLEVLSLSDAL